VTTVQRTRERTVLVIEDEPSFADAISIGLRREGFRVAIAVDGQSALDRFAHLAPDIVLLDVMLPGMSGLDVCRELRHRSQVPIIMVTARSSEVDAVVGLELGADDYVVKPHRLRELVARVRAVLRRDELRTELPEVAKKVEVGDVLVDIERHEVIVRGVSVEMPLREFELRRRHEDARHAHPTAASQDRGRPAALGAHRHHPRPRLQVRAPLRLIDVAPADHGRAGAAGRRSPLLANIPRPVPHRSVHGNLRFSSPRYVPLRPTTIEERQWRTNCTKSHPTPLTTTT
jgi:two-component system response regulator RegX3